MTMDSNHDRRAHPPHSHDRGVKISRPVFDQGRQPLPLPFERRDVAADAEQLALRRYQYGTHIFALAQLRHAETELPTKFAIDGITPIGLVENHMGEAILDVAGKTRRLY